MIILFKPFFIKDIFNDFLIINLNIQLILTQDLDVHFTPNLINVLKKN